MQYRSLCLSLGLLILESCGGRAKLLDDDQAGGSAGVGETSNGNDASSAGGSAGALDASTETSGGGGTTGTSGAAGTTSGSGGSTGTSTGAGGSGGMTTGAGGATTGTGGASGSAGTGGSAGATDGGSSAEDWILFDSDRDGAPRHIYAVRPDGTDLHRVTSQSASEVEPAISADGSKLAYVTERDGASQIDVIDLATGRITPITNRPEGCHNPGLSPDGRVLGYRSEYIIFTVRLDDASHDGGPEDGPRDGGTSDGEMAEAGRDSGPTDTIVDDYGPTWDAYIPFPGELARATGVVPSITGGPVFTDDGQWILYDTYNIIHAIHPDGTGSHNVFPAASTMQAWPTISRDGRVAFMTMCGNPNAVASIWSVPFEGFTTYGCFSRRLSPMPTDPDCSHPAWGPGDMVAWDKGALRGTGDIILWVNDVVTNVTTGPSDDRRPAWSRVRIPPL